MGSHFLSLKTGWRVQAEPDEDKVATIRDSLNKTIAVINCGDISVTENIDNALLIAASPDLFVVCQYLGDHQDLLNGYQYKEVNQLLQKALKKAYGLY